MKRFYVEDEVFKILPTLNIGVLVLKNVDEDKRLTQEEENEIKELLDNANREAKKHLTSSIISENHVVSVWREAYQKFPTKKGARCSVENLLKRVLHDNPVGTIFPSVDITNAVSLKYALPIGAEDAFKFVGDLHLGIMKGDEPYRGHGEDADEPPLPGEIAYADEEGVVCRCLNWRDAIRTEITDKTTYEFIAMECIEEERLFELNDAINELSNLMCKYLGAEVVNTGLINADNKEMIIE